MPLTNLPRAALRICTASVLALTLGAASASALTAEQKVFKEVVTVSADGTPVTQRVEADLVTPGETVVYALTYLNDEGESASDIVLTMPVPEVVIYKEGSAEVAQMRITYSADGGKSFASREAVRVSDEAGSTRVADAAEITHIRWTRLTALAPGEAAELSFAGILK